MIRQSTGIVSGRQEDCVRQRAAELAMRFVVLGCEAKGDAVARLIEEAGVAPEEVAFVGDDVNDIPAFERVGVSIAVCDAHPGALASARYRTLAAGGAGAVREIADAILASSHGPPSKRGS